MVLRRRFRGQVPNRSAEGLELIPIAEEDPDCDAFYTRLAGRIGLQRNSRAGDLFVIQLAGSVDREDVLAEAVREAVAQRRNILFDLRQAMYFSPYVKKQMKELNQEAEQFHLELGLLLGPSAPGLSVEEWVGERDSRYQTFGSEADALAALRTSRPLKGGSGGQP